MNDSVIDRAIGAVLGSAVGDALGAGYEFTNPAPNDSIEMIGGGPFGWAPGEWTDDTQMATAILDVIATGSVDIEAIGANFLAWFAAGPADVGIQTSSVLGAADNPQDLLFTAQAYLDAHPESVGNGGLMRTAPVALAALNDREQVAAHAAQIASLTHAHPDSVAACVLWSLAIQEAITTATSDKPFGWEATIRNGIEYLDPSQQDKWNVLIDAAVTGPPAVFNPNGWAVTAFQAALSAIVNTPEPSGQAQDHFADALVAAVRIGHDTDTVAAIAGGLLGARWGASALPDDWLSLLNGQRRNGLEPLPGSTLEDLARSSLDSALSTSQDIVE